MSSPRVVIIGAGIGGLSAALELLDLGMPGSDIMVYDAGLGAGCLSSYTSRLGRICETGAGRYNRSLHPRADLLIKRFQVEVEPYRFQVLRRSGLTEKPSLTAAHQKAIAGSDSFYTGLAAALGTARADWFCTLSGYEAIRDRRFPGVGGIEVATTHPETADPEAAQQDDWLAPAFGFDTLTVRVRDFLRDAGVGIRQYTRLLAARHRNGQLELELLADGAARFRTSAGSLILAIPPVELAAIDLAYPDGRPAWLADLVDVPLFKGFLLFDEPWWAGSEIDQACVIAGNQLQKIYFDTRRVHVSFYSDSWNAGYWNTLRGSGDDVFIGTVAAKAEEAVGRRLPRLRTRDEVVCRFWPVGISYLAAGSSFDGPGCARLGPAVFLASAALTDKPGWIEGTLASATTAADLAASAG